MAAVFAEVAIGLPGNAGLRFGYGFDSNPKPCQQRIQLCAKHGIVRRIHDDGGSALIVWEITRASAFVAFACYTLSVAWGITLASRSFAQPVKPQFDYHRFVAMLGFASLLVHVGTLMFDDFASVDPITLVGGGGASLAVRAGVELLHMAASEIALPVVAIGGIDEGNAPVLIAAGANAVAVVSALFDAPDVEAQARRFAHLFQIPIHS